MSFGLSQEIDDDINMSSTSSLEFDDGNDNISFGSSLANNVNGNDAIKRWLNSSI